MSYILAAREEDYNTFEQEGTNFALFSILPPVFVRRMDPCCAILYCGCHLCHGNETPESECFLGDIIACFPPLTSHKMLYLAGLQPLNSLGHQHDIHLRCPFGLYSCTNVWSLGQFCCPSLVKTHPIILPSHTVILVNLVNIENN